jgi:hypothetical protein
MRPNGLFNLKRQRADETACYRILMPVHCAERLLKSDFFFIFSFGDGSALKQRRNFGILYCVVLYLLFIECYSRNPPVKEDLEIVCFHSNILIRSGKSLDQNDWGLIVLTVLGLSLSRR